MEMTVEQMALDERKFLHDMSNQLLVAQGMGSIALKNLSKDDSTDEKSLERLSKSVKAIESMASLIKERRKILHGLS